MSKWQGAEEGEKHICSLSLPKDHWIVIYQNQENPELVDGILYDSVYEEITKVSDINVERCKTRILAEATKFWLAESARILKTLDELQEAIIESSKKHKG